MRHQGPQGWQECEGGGAGVGDQRCCIEAGRWVGEGCCWATLGNNSPCALHNKCTHTHTPNYPRHHQTNTQVCYKAPVCDGAGKTAASCKTRKVRNGTPCRTEGSPYAGLYQQVVAESSASIASVTPESSSVLAEPEAMKKHGWMQCHRCYHGHCTEFKYEYWSKINGGKKMYK